MSLDLHEPESITLAQRRNSSRRDPLSPESSFEAQLAAVRLRIDPTPEEQGEDAKPRAGNDGRAAPVPDGGHSPNARGAQGEGRVQLSRVLEAGQEFARWAEGRLKIMPLFGDRGLLDSAAEFRVAKRINALEELACAAAIYAGYRHHKDGRALVRRAAEVRAILDAAPGLILREETALFSAAVELARECGATDDLSRETREAVRKLEVRARGKQLPPREIAIAEWGRPDARRRVQHGTEGQPSRTGAGHKSATVRPSRAELRIRGTTAAVFRAHDRVARFVTPELTIDDVRLVLSWGLERQAAQLALGPDEAIEPSVVAERLPKDSSLGLALSARAAEKVAATFYAELGCAVSDVSLSQLERKPGPWLTHDLLIDGVPIDVKNSRYSDEYPTRFNEHFVKRFKTDESHFGQASGPSEEEVRVAGVLSPFLYPMSLLRDGDSYAAARPVTFLGETSESALARLAAEFSEFVDVDFSRSLYRPGIALPHWVFSYPAAMYRDRDAALADVSSMDRIEVETAVRVGLVPPPLALVAGDLLGGESALEKVPRWQRDFATEWWRVRSQLGESLPLLFLTVLRHFLRSASGGCSVPPTFTPRDYRALLYARGPKTPAGIYDPSESVAALIEILEALWKAPGRPLARMRSFRLSGLRLLRGRVGKDAPWITLVAYCGGCSAYPLVLGAAASCECGYLICTRAECRHCREGCRHSVGRVRASGRGRL